MSATPFFSKVVSPGKGSDGKIFFFVNYGMDLLNPSQKVPILTITGVEGPKANGDARGGCGAMEIPTSIAARVWSLADCKRFRQIQKEWHLNTMQAGTPLQTAELRKHTFPGYPVDHYKWAQEVLHKAGLNPDNTHGKDGKPGTAVGILGGFQYGHGWLSVQVPEDVLEFLRSLPEDREGLPRCWDPDNSEPRVGLTVPND